MIHRVFLKLIWLHKITLKVKVKSLSCVRLFATPWAVACPRLLHPWDFLGKSTEVGCHFLLQGIFPTQGSNPGLPHCRQTLYHLSHQGNSQFSQFSHSVMSGSLRPHESQHARPPCPSPIPRVHSDSRVHRVSDAIQPSHPLLSPSPAPNPSQHQSLFQWVSSSQ